MSEAAAVRGGAQRKRQVRNFLLDSGFQLKYAGYLVGITLVLSVSLGAVLWRTSAAVMAQSLQNVERGEQIVALGNEVVGESRKVSAVVRMNIVKDPVYQDNPDLLAAFNADSESQDARLEEQQQQLEQQRLDLAVQAQRLAASQQRTLWTLVIVLTLLVFGMGAAGIVVTHKVAGPIFKMKRQLGDVAKGSLRVPTGLRKGDELVDFHEAFRDMVMQLRTERQRQLETLDAVLTGLDPNTDPERLASLRELRASLEKSLVG
jgi:methyl-accepting chemotaxis protein